VTDGLSRPALVGFALALSFAALLYLLREWSGDALHATAFVVALGIALGMRRVSTRRDMRMRVLAALLVYLALALAHLPVMATFITGELAAGAAHGDTTPLAYAIAVPVSCVAPVLLAAESPSEFGPPLAVVVLGCVAAAWVVGRRTSR